MTYAEYLETTFFKPLNMKGTTVDMGDGLIVGQAVGYIEENDEFMEAKYIDMRPLHKSV